MERRKKKRLRKNDGVLTKPLTKVIMLGPTNLLSPQLCYCCHLSVTLFYDIQYKTNLFIHFSSLMA